MRKVIVFATALICMAVVQAQKHDNSKTKMANGTIVSVNEASKTIVIKQGKGANEKEVTYSIDSTAKIYEGNAIGLSGLKKQNKIRFSIKQVNGKDQIVHMVTTNKK